MDRRDQSSVLDPTASPMCAEAEPGAEPDESLPPAKTLHAALRFPGEDDGQSLSEMAQRDLEATLQLLAERAQHVTGASGAAIAFRQGGNMVCLASAGAVAPRVGETVDVNSGLAGESIRSRQTLCCNDAADDLRLDAANYRRLGVASALAMPLVREQKIVGLFELISEKANAFEEGDILALERLGEMIQTAVDHAEAANRAQSMIHLGGDAASLSEPDFDPQSELQIQTVELPAVETGPESGVGMSPSAQVERGNIGKCVACGFPVSQGRTLCLDCDASRNSDAKAPTETASAPAFFAQLNLAGAENPSWQQSRKYLIGSILLTVGALAYALWFH